MSDPRTVAYRQPETAAKCVLVVDDEPLNMKLFTLMLARRGYRVLEACDGYQGLDLARRERPDVIIMDVQLPGVSGLEVTRLLKDDPKTRDIPVIIATAFLIEEEDLLKSGCDGYMPKPFVMSQFVKLIGSLVGAPE